MLQLRCLKVMLPAEALSDLQFTEHSKSFVKGGQNVLRLINAWYFIKWNKLMNPRTFKTASLSLVVVTRDCEDKSCKIWYSKIKHSACLSYVKPLFIVFSLLSHLSATGYASIFIIFIRLTLLKCRSSYLDNNWSIMVCHSVFQYLWSSCRLNFLYLKK